MYGNPASVSYTETCDSSHQRLALNTVTRAMFSIQTLGNTVDRNVMSRADMIPYSTCQRVMFVLQSTFLSGCFKTLGPAERAPS